MGTGAYNDRANVQLKLTLVGLLYVAGGVAVGAYALMSLPDKAVIAVLIAWFFLFVVLQFALFRCARCGWPLLLARRGRMILPIGWVPPMCCKCGAPTSRQRAG